MILVSVIAALAAPAVELPQGSLLPLFKSDDYPFEALRKGEQGNVEAKLDIDASGRVVQCTVIKSSKSSSLDAKTCQVLSERAKFPPVQEGSDNASLREFRQSVSWYLPNKPRSFLTDRRQGYTFKLDQAGKVISCDNSGKTIVNGRVTNEPNCSAFQAMIDGLLSLPGRKGPAHPNQLIFDTSFDFDPPDESKLAKYDGTQIVDSVARFEVDETSRSYASCQPIGNSTINPCGTKPIVSLPRGMKLGDKERRTGTLRMRAWVSDGQEAR